MVGLHLGRAVPPGPAPRASFSLAGISRIAALRLVHPFPGITAHVVQAVHTGRGKSDTGVAMPPGQACTVAKGTLLGRSPAVSQALCALGRVAGRVTVAMAC